MTGLWLVAVQHLRYNICNRCEAHPPCQAAAASVVRACPVSSLAELTSLRLLLPLHPCCWTQVVTLAWVMASSRGPSPRRDFVKILTPALLAAIRLTVTCKLPSKPHATTTPSAMPLDADMQPQLQQSASAPFHTNGSSSSPLSAASLQHASAAGAPPRLVSAAAVGTRSIGTALWALGRLDAALQPRPAMELLRFSEAHFKVTHANHLSPCCHVCARSPLGFPLVLNTHRRAPRKCLEDWVV